MDDNALEWTQGPDGPAEDYVVFRVTRRPAEHASGRSGRFSVIHSPDWVNVIAITRAQEVVVVRQYRHGQARLTTEIPRGMIDAGEPPIDAARRELLEETGYSAGRWLNLGVVDVNPAIQTNRCHLFAALDAELTAPQALDPNEVIAVGTIPLAEIEEPPKPENDIKEIHISTSDKAIFAIIGSEDGADSSVILIRLQPEKVEMVEEEPPAEEEPAEESPA